MQTSTSQLIKRLSVYMLGIYLTAVAIAISKMTPLGISPNSSLPNEISLILDANLGLVTSIVFASFVFIQWLLLGKDFKIINFVQVLLAIILPPCDTYPLQIIYTILSAFLLGAAIKIYMTPKLMALPAEGLAQAVAQRFKVPFPTAKNICDITIVTISIILSLTYFGTLYGIREGTIIHAVLVGRSVKWSGKLFGEQLDKFIWKDSIESPVNE